MRLKNKFFIILAIMFFVLLLLPLIFINLAKPYDFMGIMILFFFIINPVVVSIIGFIIGKDIKKLWWLPILFSIVFLLSYWLILKEIVLDLIFYAIIYSVIGLFFMIVSGILKAKAN